MFAHADIQGWFLCDTEGAAQWGDIQHATQPTRASCNGRPLGVLAPALVARLMVVLSEKKTSPPDTYSTKTGIACRPEKLYGVSIACALPKGRLCNGSTCSGFENARPVQGAWNSAGGQSHNFWNFSVDSLLRVDTNIFFIVELAFQPGAGEEISMSIRLTRCPLTHRLSLSSWPVHMLATL
jgi:hypothetical protein